METSLPALGKSQTSTRVPPLVTIEDQRTPRSQIIDFPVSDPSVSFEEAVREYSQTCPSPEDQRNEDGETSELDSGFVVTSVDDVCKLPATEEEDSKLSGYLPSKIVFETRNKSRDAIRLGSTEDSLEALESGLQTLRKQAGKRSDCWALGEAEILLDLGRKEEAKKALAHCATEPITRGKSTPLRRPILRKSGSVVDAQFAADMLKFNKQSQQQNQEELLQLSLRAEDWDKARETAESLHRIDSSYFDIKKPMDRFQKCRQMLNLGILAETEDRRSADQFQRHSLAKALRLYNHGCFATELFHKHFDPPQAQVNGLDHRDCANLFFSAARVCVKFHQHGYYDEHRNHLSPGKFTERYKKDAIPCSPPLAEKDWKHQALHFMEQGRSRALLESILRGDPEEPLVTNMQRRHLMAHVALAARETTRIKKKRDSFLLGVDPRSSPSLAPDVFQDDSLRGLTDSPSQTPTFSRSKPDVTEVAMMREPRLLALGPLLDTAGTDDYKYADVLPASPSSFGGSDLGGELRERNLARLNAQMRWRKAFLYALAMSNPTLNAALPSSTFVKDASSIRSKIPADTVVIEYALVTAPPEGLITLIITSDGIEECTWQRVDTLPKDIADLLSSMHSWSWGGKTREMSPLSPRSKTPINVQGICSNLSRILIQPIQRFLISKKKLIIIPSGELAHVPWAMFLHIPVAVVPSLSIWDHLQTHSREITTPSKVSVVGNPPRNEDDTLRDGDIPFSHMEAFYIARINQDLPFLAGENNRKQFQEWVALTRVLHLCAHSTFDEKDPSRSGIQLFRAPLTIHDWRDLAIKADLVVFSSCLSGISKAFHSGSAFGFAHTLLGTGTRAFIGSLWPVDDQATLLLMMIFYDQLRKFSPAEALHRAQMAMQHLSHQDVWGLVERLKIEVRHSRVDKFVDNPTFWIRRLDNLRDDELQDLRDPRSWAAFVLTGYGFQNI
ncbi:hypothetical protein WAI453_011565 [Rhynchosporium graminicola]|uniref:CHAT domain-containing protein n=1 Tax=Rhynchosporium graminicola TaxID=2792576 RepID=A0A1E1LP25_9HELO|nr:uncharacterized protein RCO7_10451 [Rhynchosporium commune]